MRAAAIMKHAWRWMRPLCLVVAGVNAALVSVLLIAVHAFPYDVSALSPDQGGPLVITDRYGTVLRSVPAADGRPGRESWVGLSDIPSHVVMAVIASEDEHFYQHGGVDGRGIARAAWLNVRERRVGYGGSTITMQLARMIHSAGRERGLTDKAREAMIAMRLERALSKRQILEQYLNRAYYGNGAFGIEAAARTYFDKPAASLSPGEATLLAVLPRAPSAYDPLRNLGAAQRRRDHVLGLLGDRGLMTAAEIEQARAEVLLPVRHRPPSRAEHFVDWVLAELPDQVKRRGGRVRTTLDGRLQAQLEHRVTDHVAALGKKNLDHAGALVLDTRTSEVLAMVGSAGFDAEAGQLNIVTRKRHPGSALKPFVYALAIEAGDHPASIAYDIHDVPSEYRVAHLTQTEHGPVRYREALAGSYNLAAIHTLEKVGVATLMTTLANAGVGDLEGTPEDYGLRLALGSARVRLLDLAAAYGFLVRDGNVRRPSAVIETHHGDGAITRPPAPMDRQLFSPQTSWLVMDMLADSEARRQVFGHELPVDLPFPVAVKTGTSRGFADTVAIAATSEVIVAAWGGNFDGEPTQGLVAMQSAAPLVRAGLQLVAGNGALTLPAAPGGIASGQVCALSGQRAGPACPHPKREHFHAGHVPTTSCEWHHQTDGRITVRYPPEAREWARRRAERGGRLAAPKMAER
ncbi:MAG TPA: transglycosylase domain-containing protein [Kofleriaceae bacterium]|nr:transglycosylase domain-containing protein [Kofleriaceae bacterium]